MTICHLFISRPDFVLTGILRKVLKLKNIYLYSPPGEALLCGGCKHRNSRIFTVGKQGKGGPVQWFGGGPPTRGVAASPWTELTGTLTGQTAMHILLDLRRGQGQTSKSSLFSLNNSYCSFSLLAAANTHQTSTTCQKLCQARYRDYVGPQHVLR